MDTPKERFGLTYKAYEHMQGVASGAITGYDDMNLADWLDRISKNPYSFLEEVKVGPPSLVGLCNKLLNGGYLEFYTDPLADWLESQLGQEKVVEELEDGEIPGIGTNRGYILKVIITEKGKKLMEKMTDDPSPVVDPWGKWLFELRREPLDVPGNIIEGLAKRGYITITRVPEEV